MARSRLVVTAAIVASIAGWIIWRVCHDDRSPPSSHSIDVVPPAGDGVAPAAVDSASAAPIEHVPFTDSHRASTELSLPIDERAAARAPVIVGRAVDDRGRPLRSFFVETTATFVGRPGVFHRRKKTDEEGRFAFGLFDRGDEAAHDAVVAQATIAVRGALGQESTFTRQADAGGVVDFGDVEAAKSWPDIEVQDSAGVPLPHVAVTYMTTRSGRLVVEELRGRRSPGPFTVAGLPDDATVVVSVLGYGSRSLKRADLVDDPTIVVLEACAGLILDVAGLDGHRCRLRSADENAVGDAFLPPSIPIAARFANGRALFLGLPTGTALKLALCRARPTGAGGSPDPVPETEAVARFEVAALAPGERRVVHLDAIRFSAVRGVVLDERGDPAPRCRVFFSGPYEDADARRSDLYPAKSTDASGRFEVLDMVRGRYDFFAAPAEETAVATVDVRSDFVDVVLRPRPTREVALHIDGPEGKPLAADVAVELRDVFESNDPARHQDEQSPLKRPVRREGDRYVARAPIGGAARFTFEFGLVRYAFDVGPNESAVRARVPKAGAVRLLAPATATREWSIAVVRPEQESADASQGMRRDVRIETSVSAPTASERFYLAPGRYEATLIYVGSGAPYARAHGAYEEAKLLEGEVRVETGAGRRSRAVAFEVAAGDEKDIPLW